MLGPTTGTPFTIVSSVSSAVLIDNLARNLATLGRALLHSTGAQDTIENVTSLCHKLAQKMPKPSNTHGPSPTFFCISAND